MDDVRNCKKCGKMFRTGDGDLYCSTCRVEEEEAFKLVRDFLYSHPDSNASDIHEVTGVSEEQVFRFLRQGKLILKDKNE